MHSITAEWAEKACYTEKKIMRIQSPRKLFPSEWKGQITHYTPSPLKSQMFHPSLA